MWVLHRVGSLLEFWQKTSIQEIFSAKVTTVECGVCSEVVAPITFMPCGHTVVCLDCSSRMKKCLECKLPIESKVVSQEVAKKDGGKSDQALVNKLTDMEER